jgi:hypothetical protein
MFEHVDVICAGRTKVPTIEINWMDIKHMDQWEDIMFSMVLVRGGGRNILINSGPPADYQALSHFWVTNVHPNHALHVSEEDRPARALARYGLSPADYVLVTPLITYATGNLDLFPNAKICVSRRGWIDFLAPEPYAHHYPRHVYMADPIFAHVMNGAMDRIVLLDDGDMEILPGLTSYFVGSHHRSSMAYRIETAKGRVVFSDCFFKYRNIEDNIPLGIQESMEETLRAYDRIRKEADIALPMYDPEVMVRHPGGKIV